ncbi:MAG: 50S ribosomal protein L4 [Eubacteriales bacterium]|jgi:large subunit ribosomal protein L4|nr:50S ribosomal protein L4 [Eubacteriales bacterium]
MPVLKTVNMAGNETGEINLSDEVFGTKVNRAVLHAAVKTYLANQRQGTQSTLTRSEVSGGGRKPWRQKGTGRARQGSIRSPQWKHGGIALGPKPRDHRLSMNKKVRRIAMRSAMSDKVAGGNMIVIDAIITEDYKTKIMVNMLKAVGADRKALIVLPEKDDKVIKSIANIQGVKTAYVNTLNTYDILNCDKFIVAKDAVVKIEEVYAR